MDKQKEYTETFRAVNAQVNIDKELYHQFKMVCTFYNMSPKRQLEKMIRDWTKLIKMRKKIVFKGNV